MAKLIVLVVSACLFISQAIYLPPAKNGRIIGRQTASPTDFPFLAAINKRNSSGNYFCAGTLIYNPWILTAAQCIEHADTLTVRLGSNKLNDPNAMTPPIKQYFIHPDYDSATLHNDIALIQLNQSIQFTDYLRPIFAWLTTEIEPEQTVLTAGWGQTSDSSPDLADELNGVSLTTISNDQCKVTYGSQITDDMVCAAGSSNEGLCQGDVGGPLFQQGAVMDYLVGVASFLSSRGCENTDPSGFTRLVPYMEWIGNVSFSN